MRAVTDNGAFILHLIRCLGVTTYLYGTCHDKGTIEFESPPKEADCSGFQLWGYDKIALTAPGEILHGFYGGAANLLEKCRDLHQTLSVEDALKRRGSHLFLIRPNVNKGNHVGTTIGRNWFIHCSSNRKGVWIERASSCSIRWTDAGFLV